MRTKKGTIVSKKMAKTLVVRVDGYKRHPIYDKKYIVSKKFHVHTETPEKYEEGQMISIVETRPMSKTKRWLVEDESQVTEKQAA